MNKKRITKKEKKELRVKTICFQCEADFGVLPRAEVPDKCPNCGESEFWDKPPMERELFLLQKEFIETGRNPKFLKKMYQPLFNYTRILLLQKIKNKRILTKEEVDEKAILVVGRIFCYMFDKKLNNWTASDSWAGAIGWAIVSELFSKKEQRVSQIASLNQVFGDDDNSTEAQDYLEVLGYTTIYKDEERDLQEKILKEQSHLVDNIMKLIEDRLKVIQYKYSDKIELFILLCIQAITKPLSQDNMSELYEFVGYEVEMEVKKIMEYVRDYIELELES